MGNQRGRTQTNMNMMRTMNRGSYQTGGVMNGNSNGTYVYVSDGTPYVGSQDSLISWSGTWWTTENGVKTTNSREVILATEHVGGQRGYNTSQMMEETSSPTVNSNRMTMTNRNYRRGGVTRGGTRKMMHGGLHSGDAFNNLSLTTGVNEFRNRRTGEIVPAGMNYHLHQGQAMEGAIHNTNIVGGTVGHDYYDKVINGNGMNGNGMVSSNRTQTRQTRTRSGGGYRRGGRI
jgi:hypothetical protein